MSFILKALKRHERRDWEAWLQASPSEDRTVFFGNVGPTLLAALGKGKICCCISAELKAQNINATITLHGHGYASSAEEAFAQALADIEAPPLEVAAGERGELGK